MKILLSFLMVFSSLTLLAQNPIDGKWKGTSVSPLGSLEITYVLKVEGSVLKVTMITELGVETMNNGKVDGKKFSYTFDFMGTSALNEGELTGPDEITIKNRNGKLLVTRVKE